MNEIITINNGMIKIPEEIMKEMNLSDGSKMEILNGQFDIRLLKVFDKMNLLYSLMSLEKFANDDNIKKEIDENSIKEINKRIDEIKQIVKYQRVIK